MSVLSRAIRAVSLAVGAAALLTVAVADAQAAARKRYGAARVIVIKKPARNFLDPGKVPPTGSLQRYVGMYTQTNTIAPVYDRRSINGGNVLPGRFGLWPD